MRNKADPTLTAKPGSSFLLYAGLGFEAEVGLSSQVSQGCRAEDIQRICNLSSPGAIFAALAFPGLWDRSIFTILSPKGIHSVHSPDCKYLGMKLFFTWIIQG